jgi:hypothetical protein
LGKNDITRAHGLRNAVEHESFCVLADCAVKANNRPMPAQSALPEIYVSTDIETDGPVPGRHSILSIGSAAYAADKTLLATFSANLETVPGLLSDSHTARWWTTQPEAWAACRRDQEAPVIAMRRYVAWLKELPGRPVFVAYPAAFDFPFVQWYLDRFADENPYGYAVIDIKTYAMAVLRQPYRACGKQAMPAGWFDPAPHTHVALDDALEQGALFCNMLAANLARP